MNFTLEDVLKAYGDGEEAGASHMIVYLTPDGRWDIAYVLPGEDPQTVAEAWLLPQGADIQEVYKYSIGWEEQAKEYRAMHWEVGDFEYQWGESGNLEISPVVL